jgi:hypothetical protein
MNRHSSKRNTKVNKYVKNCSISSSIRGMQIKAIMRYHFTAVRMAIKKKNMFIEV